MNLSDGDFLYGEEHSLLLSSMLATGDSLTLTGVVKSLTFTKDLGGDRNVMLESGLL